jgi:MscS family membrane protein
MMEHFKNYIGTGLQLHLWNGFIAFITVMVIGLMIKYLLQTAGRKIISKTRTDFDNQLLDVILPRIKWLAIVIGLYLAVDEISVGFAHSTKIDRQFILYGEGALYVVFVSLLTILISRLIDTSVKFVIHRHTQDAAQAINDALLPLLNRLTMILVFFISVVIILGHFGVDVSSLLVFLGSGSVAIALAAQETLANMIAGFVIMIDRPFRVGDRIKLPTGEIGDVFEIGIRSTTILDFDHNLIVSPNTDLTKARVINFSYPGKEIRVLVEVSVAYGTSIERAREIMLNTALQNKDVLKQPPPEVFFSAMKEFACILQLICRVDDWKKRGSAENSLRENVYSAFIKAGISAGFTAHIVQLPNQTSNVNPKTD